MNKEISNLSRLVGHVISFLATGPLTEDRRDFAVSGLEAVARRLARLGAADDAAAALAGTNGERPAPAPVSFGGRRRPAAHLRGVGDDERDDAAISRASAATRYNAALRAACGLPASDGSGDAA